MEAVAAVGMLAIIAIAALMGRWTPLPALTIGGVLGIVPAAFVGWLMAVNYVPYVIGALIGVAAFALVAGAACGGAAAGQARRHLVERIS